MKKYTKRLTILVTLLTITVMLLLGITYETDNLNTVNINNIAPIHDNEITTKANGHVN